MARATAPTVIAIARLVARAAFSRAARRDFADLADFDDFGVDAIRFPDERYFF
jgi:hypothetical protein